MKEGGRKQGAMSPCAACKLLRRRCAQDCVFAPYFPADEPQKFASVHKVFGASNVNKMLQELPEQQRSDAVKSMVYEANARVRDPVYGCVGAISSLQQQVDVLQTQLALAQAEVVHMKMHQAITLLDHDQPPVPIASNSSSQTKSFFAMDIVVDQANMGESLWSC
ncbi:PREDICTED: LOB domain-containing protein 4-like [Lupinus angustifolius]|uniref:LOB domain-containing protein 4-like n=1 Tax=Lupinus angustifolius TaxID=3871 RepID=UPI00092F7B83|nr:PREDICTED: LOB domain-containing protein 4-like [Lupinus angustifolius]